MTTFAKFLHPFSLRKEIAIRTIVYKSINKANDQDFQVSNVQGMVLVYQ